MSGAQHTPSPAAIRAAKTILKHNLDRRKKSSREFVAKIIDRETRPERDLLADELSDALAEWDRLAEALRKILNRAQLRGDLVEADIASAALEGID